MTLETPPSEGQLALAKGVIISDDKWKQPQHLGESV